MDPTYFKWLKTPRSVLHGSRWITFHSLLNIVLNPSKNGGSNTKPWNSIELYKRSHHGVDAPTISPNIHCQNHKSRFVRSLVRPLDDGRGPIHFHSNGSWPMCKVALWGENRTWAMIGGPVRKLQNKWCGTWKVGGVNKCSKWGHRRARK